MFLQHQITGTECSLVSNIHKIHNRFTFICQKEYFYKIEEDYGHVDAILNSNDPISTIRIYLHCKQGSININFHLIYIFLLPNSLDRFQNHHCHYRKI